MEEIQDLGGGGDSLICFRHGTNVGSKIVSKINKGFHYVPILKGVASFNVLCGRSLDLQN